MSEIELSKPIDVPSFRAGVEFAASVIEGASRRVDAKKRTGPHTIAILEDIAYLVRALGDPTAVQPGTPLN